MTSSRTDTHAGVNGGSSLTDASRLGLAALFTWHVPLPHVNAGRAAAEARDLALAEALSLIPEESADRIAITLLTRDQPPSASEVDSVRSTISYAIDPLIHAALLQRLALSILDSHSITPRATAAHNDDTMPPERAFGAINSAIEIVEYELALLAQETPGVEPDALLPPEIFAELTITFIRAALVANVVDQARPAADALAKQADAIPTEHVRFHALTSVAVAYLNDGRPDEALIPAQRARSLARSMGDLTGVWRAERIRAHVASVTGRLQGEESAHREVAALARRLADDLATEAEVRTEAALSELESRSVLVRIGLSTGRFPFAEDHAMGTLDRVFKAREAGDAPEPRLWEFEIDARVARMIIAGMPHSPMSGRRRAAATEPVRGRRRAETTSSGSGALSLQERLNIYDQRRREAREAIAAAPETVRERAMWWNTYVNDRHAYLLAVHGRFKRALHVAKRAHASWVELGDVEQIERSAADIARLETKVAESASTLGR